MCLNSDLMTPWEEWSNWFPTHPADPLGRDTCCILVGLSVGGFEKTEDQISLSQAELDEHHGIFKYTLCCLQGKSDHFLHKKGYLKASKYPLRSSWFFLRKIKMSLVTTSATHFAKRAIIPGREISQIM